MITAIKLNEDKVVPKQVQLLRVGTFLFENGDQISITTQMLQSFKKNFDNKVRGYEDGKLPIDYFHENEKIAGGWMSNLQLLEENTELWAEVQWTPKAAQMLADGEIRYVSAEFHFDYQHNEGGEKFGPTLFGAGLTNRPFIKGMRPVINLAEKKDPVSEKIAKLINEGYPQDQAVAIAKDMERKGKLTEGDKPMSDEANKAAEAPLTPEEMLKKIAELEAKIEELEASKSSMMGDMAKKDAAYAEEKKMSEKRDAFNRMLAEGKSNESQRDAFMAGDMVKFAELQKPVNLKAKGSSEESKETPAETVELSAEEQVIKFAETIQKENPKMSRKDAISLALKKHTGLAEQYNKNVALS